MFLANLNALVFIHSYLRWIALVLILLLILWCLVRWLESAKRVSLKDNKTALWMMISVDVMTFIGVLLWVFGNKGLGLIQEYGMKVVMQSSSLRFNVIEHPITMIITVILLHIGKSKLNKGYISKANGHKAYRTTFILSFIALLLMLISIPWPWRDLIGRPLFPL